MKRVLKLLLLLIVFVPTVALADSNTTVSHAGSPVAIQKKTEVPEEEHIGIGFCSENDVKNALKVLGFIILVAKIAVPIIIIFMGSLDLAKAIVKGEEKAYSQQIKILGTRFFLGIIIFFIPSVLDACFSAIEQFQDIESEYHDCEVCLLKPNDCPTTTVDP